MLGTIHTIDTALNFIWSFQTRETQAAFTHFNDHPIAFFPIFQHLGLAYSFSSESIAILSQHLKCFKHWFRLYMNECFCFHIIESAHSMHFRSVPRLSLLTGVP